MLFPKSKRASAPGFKICFNDNSGAGHRIFHLDIKDVRKWRDAFKPKRLDTKADRRRQDTRASMGQWAIANSSFVICNQEDTPTPEREPVSMDSGSPCESLIFTMEKLDLLGDTKCNGTVDVDRVAERVKTERILEGTLTPDPDRDYEGEFTLLFLSFEEAQRERQPDIVDDGSKGWKFLHGIITAGQRDEPSELPAYHPSQRAFLLARKFRGAFLVTCSIRNIDACSHAELLKLIWQMEMTGWNDMICHREGRGGPLPYRKQEKSRRVGLGTF
ncbi:uncharacterized protein FFB20_04263 [Fusarium fujikuroi]|uniref:Uncharacterized protein n=2 Tax=Fusarium fujikuroi TaxID=5127 RepID=S0DK31_GIBF5|nr:uncharacterized protein FFUJ_00661 [Fusarium fujikuroi IMI 58289]KLP02984.1 uncharacterized protein Y057_9787 [Fusarium fujikuroi]KLP18330.1 uncharacterized protein LW94_5518 [Fusarium fujikuroi]CCT62755.1 uncharacterized protein FFUJ_00661 [Fusarium fujikuroi IMI 58289]SCN66881.1 uncharacterized protein FFE2_00727 [Fusarium fujikuroi]SCN69937.1 uncharacterized protein FFC1_00723 [Fusarium fujikuroi]